MTALRVTVQQPALPQYRLPVFRELAQRPGLAVNVIYPRSPHGPPNAKAHGFPSVATDATRLQIRRHPFLVERSQWRAADLDAADVLVLNWDLHNALLVPTLVKARKRNVATVLWGHGYSKNERRLTRSLRNAAAHLADAVVVYNNRAGRELRKQRVCGGRVFVAPNALDSAAAVTAEKHWQARPDALAAFQRETGLTSGPNVLFVSRLHAANRTDLLLHAIRLMRDRAAAKAIILGDGPEREVLKRAADRLGVAEHTIFVPADYDATSIAKWFMSAHVFCYPSNAGLSLLHAMAFGLPVVVGDDLRSHNPEIECVRHGENGLFFRDGDPEDLAAQLLELWDDPQRRTELAARARDTATQKYTVPRMVDGLEAAVRAAHANLRGAT